jgi:hypothetical protein
MHEAAFHRLAEDIRADIEHARALLRRHVAFVREIRSARRFLLEWRYDPDQPRVPAGSPDGGQWTSGEASGEQSLQIAQAYSFGSLIAEIPVPGGRRCVYQFSFGAVVVGGGVYVRCLPRIPSAGVVHGYFLNDN